MIDRLFKHPSPKSPTSTASSPDSPSDSWTYKLKQSMYSRYQQSNSPFSWREHDKGLSDQDDAEWIRVGQTPSPGNAQKQLFAHPGQFSPADLQGKVEYYRNKTRELTVQVTDLQDLVDHWQGEARRLQKELKRLDRVYQDTQHALSASQMALSGAHAFLDAPEECSEKEILTEVVTLNEEVKKTAAFFVEALPAMRMLNNGVDPSDVQMRAERGNMSAPPNLLTALSNPSKGGKGVMLQVAFETTLIDTCQLFLDKWFPDATLDYWIQQTYDGIRGTALQSVFGRWRTLTRTQLAAVTREVTELPLIFLKSTLDRFTDITTACGVSIDYVQLPSEWIKAMEEKTAPIAQSVIRLRRAMGEMHVQSDLCCIMATPGDVFDETLRCLRNRAGATGIVDNILCTTGLGLMSVVKESSADNPEIEEMKETILLEPEVVLECFITTACD